MPFVLLACWVVLDALACFTVESSFVIQRPIFYAIRLAICTENPLDFRYFVRFHQTAAPLFMNFIYLFTLRFCFDGLDFSVVWYYCFNFRKICYNVEWVLEPSYNQLHFVRFVIHKCVRSIISSKLLLVKYRCWDCWMKSWTPMVVKVSNFVLMYFLYFSFQVSFDSSFLSPRNN